MKGPEVRFTIGTRQVGLGAPCFVIGEVAQSHEGSLGQAHAFIEAIAKAGADAVKFQTHIAAAESTPAEPWRVKFSAQDANRYTYWKRMEFSEEQWQGLKRHADECGLIFLSSPFSIEAIELLARVGVPAWKVPSGELSNGALLERIADTRLPAFLSTGISPWSEIDAAIQRFLARDVSCVLLQCTSMYPCPPEKMGLNLLSELRNRYGCVVGLSDHSGAIYPGLAAVTLGASVLEVHVALSRDMFGPDVSSSLTTAELKQLIEGVRCIEAMQAHPVDKDTLSRELLPLRSVFTRSVVAKESLPAGTVLSEHHLALKKPGTGVPASELPVLIGRQLRRNVQADDAIRLEDLA